MSNATSEIKYVGMAAAEQLISNINEALDTKQPIGDYLLESDLSGAVDLALEQAKNSGQFDGAAGRRGSGLLPVTTAPSSYTTEVNGLTPAYRISLSTVRSQASTDEVYAGDTIRYSYYHYPVIYVSSSYVYCAKRVSIRGAAGAAGNDIVSISIEEV